MGKYVITFEDEPGIAPNREKYYKCCEIPWWVATKSLLSKLTPYTELDLDLEQVRKEAFEKGYSTAVAEQECAVRGAAEKGYQKGLSDAWEAARKIIFTSKEGGIEADMVEKIFNVSFYSDALKDYSASECIEKIRQYELEKEEKQKKEEIKVGDEYCYAGKYRCIITGITDNFYRILWDNGTSTIIGELTYIKPTGRHFPEIAEVLAKMKETES